MFGHLNNAVYYQLFDTAINGWIQTNVTLDPVTASAQGIVAESGCRYFSELHFPERLVVGVAVTRLGNSSVHLSARRFPRPPTTEPQAVAAVGHWVHVYVDRHQPPTGPDPRRHPRAAVDGLRELARLVMLAQCRL